MTETVPGRSPWWYRFRASVMAAIYWLSFVLAFGVANALHATTLPVALIFGMANDRLVFGAGLVLAVAGWLLRAWGTSYLHAEVVWNRDALADRLYIAGPFRYTRNPLYLGNLLVAAAIALFAPPVGWPIVLFAQWIFIGSLIREEEAGLRARYGEEFERYRAQVPRLLPRLIPATGEDAPHTTFGLALRSESLMAGFAGTFAAYTIFGIGAGLYPWAIAVLGLIVQYATKTRPLGG